MAEKPSYTSEEAEEILTRAARQRSHGQVSHARLLAMAEELGITPEEVAAAVAETEAKREDETLRREFIQERRASFWPHLVPFLLVNLMLLVINLLTSPRHLWFLYSLMGWGIGLASHAAHALPTKGATFEQEFAEWKRKRAQREQRKSRRASKKAEKVETTAQASPATTARDAQRAAAEAELDGAATDDATAAADIPSSPVAPSPPITVVKPEEPQQIQIGGGRRE
jgi:hypothetical protein